MLRKIVLVYVIAAAVVTIATTIMQVQPALFFIEILVGDDNTFSLTLTFLLTFLALLLPVLLVIALISFFINRKGNQMPDLYGKTGIVVRREWALVNAVYNDKILVNGEKKSSVSNGKSTFVELPEGTYKIFVKGSASNVSPVMDITLTRRQIIRLKTGYTPEPNGIKTRQYLEEDV